MYQDFQKHLQSTLQEIKDAGLYKNERVIITPQSSGIKVATNTPSLEGRDGEGFETQKPLTLIYPNARHLAPNLIAEDGSIGIRITNEAFSKALCAQLKHPVVSTSANISGHPTAHFFHEIEEAILNGADYVCRFRREDQTPHEPSSIIKLNADSTFVIIRE